VCSRDFYQKEGSSKTWSDEALNKKKGEAKPI